MVVLKKRFMVMEILLDPSVDTAAGDPVEITKYDVLCAIRDSILLNFGECSLASSLESLRVRYLNSITKLCIMQTLRNDYERVHCAITLVRTIKNCPVLFNLLDLSGSVRACKKAALKCDQAKFEVYKLMAGAHLKAADEICQQMERYLDDIKGLG